MDRALVLGGGGPLGIAWETGLAAGLAAEGVDIAKADYIQGTSAGSVVGSQLASGVSAEALAQGQLEFTRMMAAKYQASGAPPPSPPDLSKLMGFMMRFPPTGEPDIAIRKEIGQFSLTSATISEEQFLAQMESNRLAGDWPDRFACTAVDTETGELRIWRKDDGIELLRGVASSCSVPGIYPPVTIKGRRWMDGGMRSSISADKATGYKRVLLVAVIPSAIAATRMRPRLESEAGVLRAADATVEVVTPDAAAQDAFGPNLMDGTRRAPVVEAGLAQGRREAARLKSFWN